MHFKQERKCKFFLVRKEPPSSPNGSLHPWELCRPNNAFFNPAIPFHEVDAKLHSARSLLTSRLFRGIRAALGANASVGAIETSAKVAATATATVHIRFFIAISSG